MTTRCLLALAAACAVARAVIAQEHPMAGGPAAALDARAPLPLTAVMAEHQKRNMREHLAAVQAIVAALAADDLAAAGTAARKIGYSDSMAQMCQHMGAGAAGFTEKALAFHRTADTIATAAGKGDKPGVVRALGETLQACVECHAAYRQEVVDQATWERRTSDVERRQKE